ncbi:hypothetical protein PVK06_028892 [Gossypium arboreum]|uniref:S-protein homolog n=1 Tax=Gossypium arboreum TaxID=29729 RepID=A0ABR0P536_GOSAR|nr:hypothetical protein PVK06_028892 [Gossypium arboreum]
MLGKLMEFSGGSKSRIRRRSDYSEANLVNTEMVPRIKLQMVNSQLVAYRLEKQDLTGNASCSLCGERQETIVHTLRECPIAIAAGLDLCLGTYGVVNSGLHAWLVENLNNNLRIDTKIVDWKTIFGVTCWLEFRVVVNQALWMANNIHNSIPSDGSSSSTAVIQVKWELPPLGWVKLNINGVVQPLEGWASIGLTVTANGGRATECERRRWHIYTVNGLSKDQTLLVHCKSKDDDLGIHNLTIGSEFTWKFRPRFFGGTLFWCYMAYDNLHASFKAFWDNQAFYNWCDWGTCFWIAKDDGIYIKNIPKSRDDYYCNWEQGRL